MKVRATATRTPTAFFAKRSLQLQLALHSSAFRRGTSAFRYGLIQSGVSDHLPFVAHVKHSTLTELNFMSWNLLADTHLYNNFMNISGSAQLAELIKEAHPEGNVYYQNDNKLFYFFAELARFIHKNNAQDKIKITKELLLTFVSTEQEGSNLARSRDIQAAIEKKKQVEAARLQIVNILINEMQLDNDEQPTQAGGELKIAIQHSVELMHHIENTHGTLQWGNRFARIKGNKPLVDKIVSMDFICLQECTNPNDIRDLLSSKKTNHTVLSYNIDNSRDHAVLVYDTEKFELIGDPVKYALEGKKPAIFAKFKSHNTGEVLVVASIHHPGGKHNLMQDLLQQVELLRVDQHASAPFYILGDYNHTHEFFQARAEVISSYQMIYPATGTMAGSDYGNVNKAIDAIVTSQAVENITVNLVNELPVSPPASPSSLVVEFAVKKSAANLSFFKQVGQQSASFKNDTVDQLDEIERVYLAPVVSF
jgi:hypothetical protein